MPTILIIDDHPLVRLSLRRLLERAGYRVITACDGREGISLLKSAAPDVIVLDLLMPEMDGIEVIQQLKKEAPCLPVLAMSAQHGSAGIDYLQYAKQFGAAQALRKPFSTMELLHALQEVLAPEMPGSPACGG